MNNKDIKLVAIDLDGTLVIDRGEISQYTKEKLVELKKLGLITTLLTGKHHNDLQNYMIVTNKNIPYVTSNGTQIWKNENNLLWEKTLNNFIVKDIVYEAIRNKLNFRLYSTIKSFNWNEIPENILILKFLRLVIKCDTPYIYNFQRFHYKILRYCKKCKIEKQTEKRIDIHPINADKKNGIERVAKLLHLDCKNVMVIGDSINDIEALKWAGIGVAMKNSKSIVRKASDIITRHDVTCDGAIKFLLEFFSDEFEK